MSKILIERELLARHVAELDAWNASIEKITGRPHGYRRETLEALREAATQAAQASDHVEDVRNMVEPATAQDEREIAELIAQRDNAEDWANKLSDAIASHTGAYIGEHSNMNCPWANALEAIENTRPAQTEQQPEQSEVVEALGSMTCAYRMAIQAGHARITALGGECDSVERMLADFPNYGKAVELYKSCRTAKGAQP